MYELRLFFLQWNWIAGKRKTGSKREWVKAFWDEFIREKLSVVRNNSFVHNGFFCVKVCEHIFVIFAQYSW